MARDQPVGRGRFDSGIPGVDHGLQQRERHDRHTDAENRQQAAELVAQRVAKNNLKSSMNSLSSG